MCCRGERTREALAMNPGQRIAPLDAGRTLAVLGVIAVHVAPWITTSPDWLDSLTNLGQYGVQCFYVISAITIAATLGHDMRYTGATREMVRNFYVKRVARIVPLYYVAIVGYAFVDYVVRRAHGTLLEPHDFADVVANMLFVHPWIPSSVDSVVPGGWSIGVEMTFYALAPLLVFMCRTTRGLVAVSIATALCSVSFWHLGACGGVSACRIVNNEFFYFWPPTQLPCFIVGFWVWHLGKRYLVGDAVLPASAVIQFAIGGSILLAATYVAGTGMGLAHGLAPTLAALATSALMLVLTRVPRRMLRLPAVVALGRNSYGIYVGHFVVILLVRAAVKVNAIDDFAEYHAVLVFAVAMVFTIALSYVGALVTTRYIEDPCSRWARRWLAIESQQRVHGLPGDAVKPTDGI
jgi:peptidoglycan/LPS O-acetylase OafA/YrhL